MRQSQRPDPRRWWALVALCLAVLIVAIDVTVLNVALPSLSESLHPTGTQTLWIADAYSFVLAGLLITMGTLGDRWGRKRMLLTGSAGFAMLSLATAFAPNSMSLILGRAALGIAGATLMPSTLSLIRNTFTTPKERTFAIGVWSAMASAGEAIGPIVAGVLLDHFWWGSVFLVNIPICLLVIGIGWFALRESRNPVPGPVDLPSVVLSMVGLLSAVAGIKLMAANGADDVTAWVCLMAGVIGLVWFARRQLWLPIPMIDVRLFQRPSFSGAVMADVLSVFGLAGMLLVLSLQLQFGEGLTPLQTGMQLLPATVGAVVAAPTTGKLVALIGRRRVICGGLLLTAIGLAGLALTTTRGEPVFVASMLFVGFGSGWSFTATAEAIMLSAPPERSGAASAVSETAYELGSALGIAILGTVLTLNYRHGLVLPTGVTGSGAEVAKDSIAGAIEVAASLPADVARQLLEAAKASFSHSAAVTTITAAAVLLVGAVTARFMLPKVDPRPVESASAGHQE